MKKPRHRVSDHAVLRYIQRVQGVDIEALRRRIGQIVDRHREHDGASGVVSGGFVYKLQGGVVATIISATRRNQRTSRKGGNRPRNDRS
ncbi:hypothetical protein [Parasedimentitalea psychrophila]|uniref:Uncharacterized protein n=1 Tax=Parasedimentitalea psychrophila TaxID=2997337 RepID=A0A9Y2KXN6_9RHOB|nr:hypothetical protein [Parasedimentitalea psychrophila]WIY25040.1 hypothetical protein QPJ95_21545 [Parasedimentitalea psychrophila]